MSWVKGQSGNPTGRPKVNWQVRERAKQHAMEALERFLTEMLNPDPKIALPACKEILRLAGVSFDSDALVEALKTAQIQPPTPAKQLSETLAQDEPPLN